MTSLPVFYFKFNKKVLTKAEMVPYWENEKYFSVMSVYMAFQRGVNHLSTISGSEVMLGQVLQIGGKTGQNGTFLTNPVLMPYKMLIIITFVKIIQLTSYLNTSKVL